MVKFIVCFPPPEPTLLLLPLLSRPSSSICLKKRWGPEMSLQYPRNHVESKHFPGAFSYSCPVCARVLESKKALENHTYRQGLRIRIRIESGFNRFSRSGSRRAKMIHKSREKLRNFMIWSAGCSFLRAETFFCNLDVLYGGLGKGK
jgi:hypothetical protein